MDKSLFIKELRPYLYLMDEAGEATGYLVIGKDKACVIDTMNGYNDIRAAVRKITDKPIILINTHGHGDHVCGNIYFDEEAYMDPADIPLSESFIINPDFKEFCRKTGRKMPPFKPLCDGDIFDLGNKTLKVVSLPGHTKGSILLLLKEDRILFTGDAINHHLWLQLDGCYTLSAYLKELDKIMYLENEADLILHGHASGFDDISLMHCFRDAIKEIIDGKTENDSPYEWFGGTAMQHPFKVEEGKEYERPDNVIVYLPDKIWPDKIF
ncbi:MAG TPA: MBL fold metallo-hydrolase [Lachnospiraceae bacterium]|nr:MBL fold metallo-hydrolase [Lachnospiraceae bacterium]